MRKNKYNRQKGTYRNGDGKDASHKGGKIVGFEKESTNRGRAEKSRLKKEINDYVGNILEDLCLCEACQKGYMTHPTRKTKIMFGKRYRNCIKKEDVNEAVYKLKRGSTNKDLDELDALLARAGFKGKPDFNKMTWSIKNKNPKIAKIIKSKGGKKIKESVNEKVNKSDLKYQLDMSLDNLGIGTKALIVMKPKGKDFFLKMKSYMYQDSMEAVLKDTNKNLDSKLKIKDFKKTRMGTEFIIGEGVQEADLGLTYKKGKTVKVKHKTSGKSIVIIDKPNVRKEYEKIGFFAEGTCGYGIDGKIGEEPAGPNLMKKIKKISKDKENKKLLKSRVKEDVEMSKGVKKLMKIADT
jgi:hypothetical protein